MIPGGNPSECVLRKDNKRVTLVRQGPIVFTDASLVLKSALRSSGFALFPSVAVRDELRSGKFCRALSDWQAQTIGIFAPLPSRIGANHRLSKLIAFLRACLAESRAESERTI